MAQEVELYVYDLSNGMARQMSMQMTGKYIEGIWHTSIVVHGLEIYYGQGVSIVKPGTTQHGRPLKVIPLGTTHLDRDTLLEYVEGMRDVYTADKYHLLEFNCNTFSNDVAGFLTGSSIPQDIIDLPKEFLSTPFGASLRPMIDQMFRRPPTGQPAPGIGIPPTPTPTVPPTPTAAAPRSQDEAASLLQSLANSAYSSSPTTTTTSAANGVNGSASTSISSPLTICTNLKSFDDLLRTNKVVVVMFTSQGCPPCNYIKPTFESISASYLPPSSSNPSASSTTTAAAAAASARKKVAFVVVDTMSGFEVANRYGVRATPTFYWFLRGEKVEEMAGANAGALKEKTDLVVWDAYPPHPHTKLEVPTIHRLSQDATPLLYPTKPNLQTALSKLSTSLSSTPSSEETISVFETKVVPFLTRLQTETSSVSQTAPSQLDPPNVNLVEDWSKATLYALGHLAPEESFPVVDFLRLGVLDPRIAKGFAAGGVKGIEEDPIGRVLDVAGKALDDGDRGTNEAGKKPPRAFLLTTIRLLSNCLKDPILGSRLMNPHGTSEGRGMLDPLTRVLTGSLLFPDKLVRTSAAGLVYGVVGWVGRRRVGWIDKEPKWGGEGGDGLGGGEDWEVEIGSAVVEGLRVESESVDVVHRLAVSLGILFYLSPHHAESLAPLADTLELREILRDKKASVVVKLGKDEKEKKEVGRVLDEVGRLCAC